MKDPRVEKPKSKPHESNALTLERSNSVVISDQAQKEKKKKDK